MEWYDTIARCRYERWLTFAQTFRNPKELLLERLKESGPAGEAVNGAAPSKPEKKRNKGARNVDMEKLAEALPQLPEDDLLQVVQMVHDNKSEETYTKNDVESQFFLFFNFQLILVFCPRFAKSLTFALTKMENSTSTSTPCQTSSSRCYGTSPRSESI